ncbi:MAG: hypothetical protein IKE31_12095 [Eubacterium sp.]|nr:hypothetical protein [Eubacterium sp.]
MAEYSRELYMQIERANRTASFAIGSGVKAVLLLYQFFARLEKEGLLSGGEITDLDRFLKATEGRYDIMNIPYPAQDAASDALGAIRQKLDAAGIRYCVLPDMDPADRRVQVAVYSPDTQKFSAFYTGYMRAFLSGGKKDFLDLYNFTDGNTSIISFPDEAREDIEKTLGLLKVDYAPLPDLNLKDGEFQLSVASRHTDTVLRAYRLYREGLLKKGQSAPEARIMREEDYHRTALLSEEQYIHTAPERVLERTDRYGRSLDGEKARMLDAADSRVSAPDWFSFKCQMDSGEYVPIVIDKKTLVDDSAAEIMMERYPHLFMCRLPGTDGEEERLLCIPKPHVFFLEDAAGPQYIAFLRKGENPRVLGKSDKGEDLLSMNLADVLYRFDAPDLSGIREESLALLSDVPFPAPVK